MCVHLVYTAKFSGSRTNKYNPCTAHTQTVRGKNRRKKENETTHNTVQNGLNEQSNTEQKRKKNETRTERQPDINETLKFRMPIFS